MKHTLLLLAMITALFSAAQDHDTPDPVKWSFSQAAEEDAVLLTATIESGWHIYGLVLENEMGPLPTVFDFDAASADWGALDVPEPKKKYDDMFMMNVTYYENGVTFKKHFANPKGKLKGSVEFMVCNEEMCLPPTIVNFELP